MQQLTKYWYKVYKVWPEEGKKPLFKIQKTKDKYHRVNLSGKLRGKKYQILLITDREREAYVALRKYLTHHGDGCSRNYRQYEKTVERLNQIHLETFGVPEEVGTTINYWDPEGKKEILKEINHKVSMVCAKTGNVVGGFLDIEHAARQLGIHRNSVIKRLDGPDTYTIEIKFKTTKIKTDEE